MRKTSKTALQNAAYMKACYSIVSEALSLTLAGDNRMNAMIREQIVFAGIYVYNAPMPLIPRGETSFIYRSKAAKDDTTRNVVYEHIIPMKVCINHLADLKKNGKLTFDTFKKCVAAEARYICGITKEEDKHLNKIGLNSKMPAGWKIGDDPFARYKAAKIEVVRIV